MQRQQQPFTHASIRAVRTWATISSRDLRALSSSILANQQERSAVSVQLVRANDSGLVFYVPVGLVPLVLRDETVLNRARCDLTRVPARSDGRAQSARKRKETAAAGETIARRTS
jgi:hypothetical protein